MWLMLQQDEPDDYVVATGETHSVQELVEVAFAAPGSTGEEYVVVDPELQPSRRGRPAPGRRHQGARQLGLAAEGALPRVWSA